MGKTVDIPGFTIIFQEEISGITFTHYTKINYIDDISFIIQGLPNPEILKIQHIILLLFGKIVVSTWDKYNLSDINNYIKQKKIYNVQNIYYQMYTTYKGLEKTNTPFAIKIRSDEIYSDWEYFISEMKNHPNKITCNNIFFRKNSILLHSSDHILGGDTLLLKKTCEKCIRNLYNRTKIPCINKDLYWRAPEVWITTAHLELFYTFSEVYNTIDQDKTREMMINHYNIVDIDKMGIYLIVFHHFETKHIITPFNKHSILRKRSIVELKKVDDMT
jgi:hypothetical protein